MFANGVAAALGGQRMTEIPWAELQGGYRVPFDPRPAIAQVAAGGDWDELWGELHHQGDVDTASYAALPLIADLTATSHRLDWNPFALAATIEEARVNGRNPPLPDWAGTAYKAAWKSLVDTGLAVLADAESELLVTSIVAVIALHKRLPLLARFAMQSEKERGEILAEIGWA